MVSYLHALNKGIFMFLFSKFFNWIFVSKWWRNISKSTLMSVLVILARFLCLNDRQNGRKSKNKVQIAEILCFFLKKFQTEQLRRLARKKQKPIDFSLCAINCVYTKAHFFPFLLLQCLRHDQKFKITL